jgi:beta-lactamase regulating signal transducer with metallopeptidase domain
MPTLLEWVLSNAVTVVLLASVVALVAHFVRRPAIAHGLWLLVLLKLIMPPLVPVSLAWLASPPEHATARAEEDGTREPLPAVPYLASEDMPPLAAPVEPIEAPTPNTALPRAETWLLVPLTLWAAGSLTWFGATLLQVWRFERLLRYAQRAPEELQAEARRFAQQLGLRRCPAVWLVPGAVSPMVWAAGRAPRVLFPIGLLGALNAEQRATLLVHELAHVRRGDPWVRLVEWLVLGLYWWHPVAWWARRELREAEEQCCDAWVVWACEGAGRTYAQALVQTVAFFSQARSPLPVVASGIGPVPRLRRRLTMIMRANTPKSLSWVGWLAVLGLAFLLLPLAPVQGQQPEPSSQEDAVKKRVTEYQRALEALARAQAEEKQAADYERVFRVLAQKAAQNARGEVTVGSMMGLGPQAGPVDEVEAARMTKVVAELKALKMEIDKKRRELQSLEQRFEAANRDLQKLHADRKPRTVEGTMAPSKAVTAETVAKVLEEFMRANPAPQGEAAESLLKSLHRKIGAKPVAADTKSADLEKKLDRLLKEVDELRHELRRERPDDPNLRGK